MDIGHQIPCSRSMNQNVSSGMFAFQIRKYWENVMYAQNTVNANAKVETSCNCLVLNIPLRGPLATRYAHVRIMTAVAALIALANIQTPNMVENQWYSKLMIQSKAAAVHVKATKIRPAAACLRLEYV